MASSRLVSQSKFTEVTKKILDKLDTLNINVTAIRSEVSDIRSTLSNLEISVADSSSRITANWNKTL